MPHDHHHSHAEGNLKTAFFLNFLFTLIEIVGGLWTNSIAILADAIHDAGDTASLGLAWYFERFSKKGRDPQNTYGFVRYRLLGGLITGLFLIIGLAFVLYHALARLQNPEAVNAPGMLLLAIVGVVVNGFAVLRVRKGSSLTEKVVSWHLLEDTLGWIAVLIGALVMTFFDFPIIDPLLSIGISLFVLWNVVRNLKKVSAIFLQKTPTNFDCESYQDDLLNRHGITGLQHFHVWSLDGEHHVASLQLKFDSTISSSHLKSLKESIRNDLHEQNFTHVTIETDPADP